MLSPLQDTSANRLDFVAELRVSPVPLAFLMLGTACVLVWIIGLTVLTASLLIVSLGSLLSAWLDQHHRLGHACLLIGLTGMVLVLYHAYHVPGLLALLAVPAGLAAGMFNLRIATIVGALESGLLLALSAHSVLYVGQAELIVALILIWAAIGLMAQVYEPIYGFIGWAEEYYQRTQQQLLEAIANTTAHDQTLKELAHAGRQLTLSNERLAALRLIAEEAEKTKMAFVSKVSHELRTPLNMIIGLVDLMVKSPDIYGQPFPAAAFEDLQVVYRNCEHLSSLINDVLDLTQVESGRMTLHKERTNIATIVDEAMGVVQPLIRKKHLWAKVELPPDLPLVYCDRTRIRQALLNLLSNAARFTDKGGVSIRVECKDAYVVLSVSDTGPGIPEQDRDRIFTPFCQGSQALWLDKGGSGLGLSISKQFVELHGGRIWFESTLGEGTTFSFDLPISEPIGPNAAPNRWIAEDWEWVQPNPEVARPDLRPKPRLVICDPLGEFYPSVSRFADEVDLVEAGTTDQLISQVMSLPATAAIINSPEPNTLWQQINALKHQLPNTPVMGCAIPSQRHRAWEADALDYLIKPITRDRLRQALERAPGPLNRVLLVDDDPDVQKLITRMIRSFAPDIQVTAASNGEQGLALMRTNKPDLVLVDIIMQSMDGWQLIALKNADPGICNIPVIFVSAQDPSAVPIISPAMVVSIDEGLPTSKLLRCALAISATLLQPDAAPGPTPG
jgi:signal transduction histidine kinase/CheY-like chemotaxis protein